MPRADVIDRYFMEHRAKLLDVASANSADTQSPAAETQSSLNERLQRDLEASLQNNRIYVSLPGKDPFTLEELLRDS